MNRSILQQEHRLGFPYGDGIEAHRSEFREQHELALLDMVEEVKYSIDAAKKMTVNEADKNWMHEQADYLFDKVACNIWLDAGHADRTKWKPNAALNTCNGLYPEDLYWSDEDHRERLRKLFRELTYLKVTSALDNMPESSKKKRKLTDGEYREASLAAERLGHARGKQRADNRALSGSSYTYGAQTDLAWRQRENASDSQGPDDDLVVTPFLASTADMIGPQEPSPSQLTPPCTPDKSNQSSRSGNDRAASVLLTSASRERSTQSLYTTTARSSVSPEHSTLSGRVLDKDGGQLYGHERNMTSIDQITPVTSRIQRTLQTFGFNREPFLMQDDHDEDRLDGRKDDYYSAHHGRPRSSKRSRSTQDVTIDAADRDTSVTVRASPSFVHATTEAPPSPHRDPTPDQDMMAGLLDDSGLELLPEPQTPSPNSTAQVTSPSTSLSRAPLMSTIDSYCDDDIKALNCAAERAEAIEPKTPQQRIKHNLSYTTLCITSDVGQIRLCLVGLIRREKFEAALQQAYDNLSAGRHRARYWHKVVLTNVHHRAEYTDPIVCGFPQPYPRFLAWLSKQVSYEPFEIEARLETIENPEWFTPGP